MTTIANDTADDTAAQTSRLAAVRDSVAEKSHAVRETVSDKTHAARDAVGDAYGTAKDTIHDGYVAAREKAHDAATAARETAEQAYRTAREKASSAAKATASGIEANPIIALAGGLALGAIAGALVPRTDKEKELLGPLGQKLNTAARDAAGAAREAGLAALEESGINKDAARQKVSQLVDVASQAAGSAGSAAVDAVRKPE